MKSHHPCFFRHPSGARLRVVACPVAYATGYHLMPLRGEEIATLLAARRRPLRWGF